MRLHEHPLDVLADADQHPRTAAAADVLASYIGTEQYLWGLHRLLDGIAAPPPP